MNRTRAQIAGVIGTLVPLGVLIGLTIWADWHGPSRVLDLVTGILAWAASPLVLWRPVGGALVITVLALVSPTVTPARRLALHVPQVPVAHSYGTATPARSAA